MYNGRRTMTLKMKMDRYCMQEFGIEPGDLDFRFKIGGTRYRIKQFTWLWLAGFMTECVIGAWMSYWTLVALILIGGCF